jgi:cytidylate kinase
MGMSRVVAIDGPAGSGKSTTARGVAERLGLPHLESGALYRALTRAALDHDTPPQGQQLVALARSLPIRLALTDTGFRPEVAGTDVSKVIRSEEVTARVSQVSAIPEVRQWANAELRDAARRHPRGAVLDGRDIGTVVFPDAALKVFLTATPEERARRRLAQEGRASDSVAIREETETLRVRDHADSTRPVAPLKPAEDAVVLDTTGMGFEEQVEAIVELARNALP